MQEKYFLQSNVAGKYLRVTIVYPMSSFFFFFLSFLLFKQRRTRISTFRACSYRRVRIDFRRW